VTDYFLVINASHGLKACSDRRTAMKIHMIIATDVTNNCHFIKTIHVYI